MCDLNLIQLFVVATSVVASVMCGLLVFRAEDRAAGRID